MTRYNIGLKASDIPEDQPVRVDAGGSSIIIIKHAGELYGLDPACTHAGGPLEDGMIDGESLVCPIHEGKYNLKTGQADPSTNWVTDLKAYKIEEDVSTGEVVVEV